MMPQTVTTVVKHVLSGISGNQQLPRCLTVILLLSAAILTPLPTQAQQTAGALNTDTLDIRFRLDSIRIDMDFEGNGERWARFERHFRQHCENTSPTLLRLDIYAGASPEGTAAHNQWLGECRGQAIRRLVRQRLGRALPNIIVHNEGARWSGLYELVAASREPWRDEVLDIIEMNASPNPNIRDQRENRLRALRGGTVWPILLERYLAPLRSGASAILSWQGSRDTIVVRDTIVIATQGFVPGMTGYAETAGVAMAGDPTGTSAMTRRDSLLVERLQYPAWAVKTNLLLWGVVAPNIEVEIPLGRRNRWSLELEYFTPWFTWSDNARASQCQNIGLELRYWLGNRLYHRWLQGWHAGLAVAVGYYDLEWRRSDGYQGEYVNSYLNLGYQLRWGTHWALDASVGIGALFTKYRHYYGSSTYPDNHLTERDDLLIWHDSDNFRWLGPCHAAISLAYLFNAWPFHTRSEKVRK